MKVKNVALITLLFTGLCVKSMAQKQPDSLKQIAKIKSDFKADDRQAVVIKNAFDFNAAKIIAEYKNNSITPDERQKLISSLVAQRVIKIQAALTPEQYEKYKMIAAKSAIKMDSLSKEKITHNRNQEILRKKKSILKIDTSKSHTKKVN